MNEIRKNSSTGQVLVLITLILAGVFAMFALVLDGGTIYAQRQQAKQAANAAAQAGALHLCGEEPNWFAASNEAYDYAVNHSHAQDAIIAFPEDGTIEVTTNMAFDPSFVQIIGITDLNVSARAAVQCPPQWDE